MTNIQQGFSDLVLAGVIILVFFFAILLTKVLWKIIDLIIYKIKINLELKKDHLRSLGLKK